MMQNNDNTKIMNSTYNVLMALMKIDEYGRYNPQIVSYDKVVKAIPEIKLDMVKELLRILHNMYIINLDENKDENGNPLTVSIGLKGIKAYDEVLRFESKKDKGTEW